MPYDRFKHHRRSIRLKGYDYSQNGAYFVTIRTQNSKWIFGQIVDGKMELNEAGHMVETVWTEILVFYPGIVIDVFQIMPNHFHGIIIITVGATPCGCPLSPKSPESPKTIDCPEIGRKWNFGMTGDNVDVDIDVDVNQGQARGPARTAQIAQLSLPDVVHRFKTMTTKRYADGVKYQGWPPFSGKLWQRNYYERIIRNQNEFNRIRHYIVNNPINWVKDIEHPANPGATTKFPDDICKEI